MTTTITLITGKTMTVSISQDVFTGIFYSTLLGGTFSNCHGYGRTADESITGLKIRLYQLL